MELSLANIATILIFYQTSLFAIFLVTIRRHRNLPNRLLALYLFIFGALMIEGILYESFYFTYPQFAFIINITASLLAPLIYLYVRTLVFQQIKLKFTDFIHSAAFIGLSIWSIFTYHILSQEDKLKLLTTGEGLNETMLLVINIIIHLYFAFYLVLTIQIIRRHNKLVKENFSESSKVNSKWLNQLVILIIINTIRVFLENIIESLFPGQTYEITLIIIFTYNLFFVNWLIYKALKVPEIFQGVEENTPLAEEMDSGLLTEENREELKRLDIYMEANKPYLNSELSLHGLAKQVNMASRELSILINSHLNKNFFDYVNSFRIKYAQQLLENPDYKKHTVLEIMYDSGFNSKSSFNTAFKKTVGVSPTQYRKNKL